MTENKNEFYDRTDPAKWAHPTVAEGWSGGGLAEAGEDILDPSITVEEADRRRNRLEAMVTEMMGMWPLPPELTESGTFTSVEVPVSDFEPDAPPIQVLVRTPNGGTGARRRAIFLVPGGGLSVSDPKMFGPILMGRCAAHGAVVVAPKYRVAPRWKYPAAVNDLHAAFKWMVDNADDLNIDPDLIVIDGDSSGGHLAAALTHRLKRLGYPGGVRPRALILEVPVIDDREFEPSRRMHTCNWNPIDERKSWKAWLGDNYNNADMLPEAVPGHATGDDFKGLPPAFIHCNEHDHGRDDVIRYAKGLLDAGVFCDLHVWGGFSHVSGIVVSAEPVRRMNALIDAQIEDAFMNDLRRS